MAIYVARKRLNLCAFSCGIYANKFGPHELARGISLRGIFRKQFLVGMRTDNFCIEVMTELVFR